MRKSLTVDVLNRIYRASPGEVIDGKYVRMFGHYEASGNDLNEDAGVDEYTIGILYSFSFKDLTDDFFWRYSRVLDRASEPGTSTDVVYKPLFSRDYETPGYLAPVTWAGPTTRTSTVVENVENYN
ncbi:hypothetical protein GWD52_02265 [Enterobacteriaceae bacterium 4M9]|nr:hypothetical protein [Enterobacteriaceae bacterium 4M9]